MSFALPLNTLTDTTLWKHLNEGYANTPQHELAAKLAIHTKSACEDAVERIKRFPYFHPEFTLHDERHLVRVAELMALILGEDVKFLNPIEIALLLLSAYYHDQGMVPEVEEWNQIKTSPEFKSSLDRWKIENPNLSDIEHQLDNPRLSDSEKESLSSKRNQHLDAHRTEYLRMNHGEHAEQLVNRLFGGTNRLMVNSNDLAPTLGRLCASHVRSASLLTDENSFHIDQRIGTHSINLRFLAVILRLADILDFDRDRTPEALLRTISLTSPVSLIEWAKHRSVEGWEILPERIRFSLSCEHPAYQKAAYEFMDTIDMELREAHRIVDEFPRGTPKHYQLQVPKQVQRDRIIPKNNAYRYADLEFRLSRNEIVKLLMTDKLYNNSSLFVRELIQNSLDALRHRDAVYGKGTPDWEGGKITLKHFIDADGNQVVNCTDNGIGMDEAVVRNFLTNAGKSYYRSPEFAQQRIGFRDNEVDFDPCAQFGIGFMSCFMFGDHINIKTRRDYGPGRSYGDPLEIEISGLGGLLVIRDGTADQPVGTSVEIIGDRKPAFLDDWSDAVRLCAVVEGYALATEFPIIAETDIDEIKGKVEVPTTIAVRKTRVEKVGVERRRVIEYNLKKTNPLLRGTIRIGLLVDDKGIPTTDNGEARWEPRETKNSHEVYLRKGDKTLSRLHYSPDHESVTCMDGILVCGQPGRDEGEEEVSMLGWQANRLTLGDPFVADIRGTLKPEITPSRQPPEVFGATRDQPSWSRVNGLLEEAHAAAWKWVLECMGDGLAPDEFWKLSLFHRVPVYLLDADTLWRYMELPILGNCNTECDWVHLSEVASVKPVIYGGEKNKRRGFELPNQGRIGFPGFLSKWCERGYADADDYLVQLVLRFCHVDVKENVVCFSIERSQSAESSDRECGTSDRLGYASLLTYVGDASDLLSAQAPIKSVNRQHPIVRYVQDVQDVKRRDRSDFEEYCDSVMSLLSNEGILSELGKNSVEKGRHYKRLGTIFRAVDWNQHNSNLAPPYKVWTENGVVEITEHELSRWADFPSGE